MEVRARASGLNWYLQRVTAVMLVVGLVGHFVVLHYGGLFGNDVVKAWESTKDRFAASPLLWLLFDGMLLVAGLYHALNGLYNILCDYSPRASTRRVVAWTLWIVGVSGVVAGLVFLARFVGLFSGN